ncbi:MAG: IS1182 family transposase [Chloroflexia bacterium]
MSLASSGGYSVPVETARVAHAIFPQGHLYLRLYDTLGSIYQQRDFADMFSALGRPAIDPVRLALVSILQFLEGLTDEQAANAVRTRIDWKYLLGLDLTDPGFDRSVLSEFRSRLLSGSVEQLLLDALLAHFHERGLLKTGGRVRTDSTHVLGAIRATNRLELVIETLRHALNSLAVVAPEWLLPHADPHWLDRYGARADDFRLPKKETERTAYALTVGRDGFALLAALDDATSPPWLRQVRALQLLRRVWWQNYTRTGDQVGWRDPDNIPPATLFLSSPYDPEAHYAKKRTTSWVGYKVHLTETCDEDAPRLITHVETRPAPEPDTAVTPVVHQTLKDKGLSPRRHLVDMGYIETELVVESQADYGVELYGPMRGDYRRQAHEGQGFAVEHFEIDWEGRQVECPQGKLSSSWTPVVERGKELIKVKFATADCKECPCRALCTDSNKAVRRTLTLKPRGLHEALREGRLREHTEEYKKEYAHRAGIEGTLSQGVRGFGLRRTRYIGQAETHLGHVMSAIAINLVRFDNWLQGKEPVQTRQSAFVKLLAPT